MKFTRRIFQRKNIVRVPSVFKKLRLIILPPLQTSWCRKSERKKNLSRMTIESYSVMIGYKVSKNDYFDYVDGKENCEYYHEKDADERQDRSYYKEVEISDTEAKIVLEQRSSEIAKIASVLPSEIVFLIAGYDNSFWSKKKQMVKIVDTVENKICTLPDYPAKAQLTKKILHHDVDEEEPFIIGLEIYNTDREVEAEEKKKSMEITMDKLKTAIEKMDEIKSWIDKRLPKLCTILESGGASPPSVYLVANDCACCT